jgi:ribosomal protein S18 acetylase RimI-like enzyme
MAEDFRLRDLRPDEYAAFRSRLREGYAEDMIRLGGRDEAFSRAKAAAETDALLPSSGQPEEQVIRVAETVGDGPGDPRRIGHVWVASAPTGDPMAWVFDVEVEPDRRGQGWGRVLMVEGERIAAQLGYDRVGLNVFGGNTAAIGLYTSLGYAVAAQVMVKSFTG